MKRHFVLLDIDHTLLSDRGELLESNVRAVEAARRRGAIVVLATARSFVGARPVHQALKLDTPVIASNGTIVYSAGGKVLKSEPIEAAKARSIVELFLESDHHWAFRDLQAAYLHPEFVTDLPHMQDRSHYRPTPLHVLHEVLGDYSTLVSASLFSNGHVLNDFYQTHDWHSLGLRSSFYPANNFEPRQVMSVISLSASKGEAAKWLKGYLGLNGAPVVAFGDSADDVSMYELGTGVAPANASPAALERADWVAPHSDEGAVAAGIRRFLQLEDVAVEG